MPDVTLCTSHAFSHQYSQEPCETDIIIIIPYIDEETEA